MFRTFPCLYVDIRESMNARKSHAVTFTLLHWLENCCFMCYQENVHYVGATLASLLCTTSDRRSSWPAFCLRTLLGFSVDAREAMNARKSPVVHFTLHRRLKNCCFYVLPTKRPPCMVPHPLLFYVLPIQQRSSGLLSVYEPT